MDQVEVDIAEIEFPEAALESGLNTQIGRPELRRDKDFLARNTALSNSLAHAPLIAIELGRINQAIARLERPPDGVFRLLTLAHLPDAKPERRHGEPVVERY